MREQCRFSEFLRYVGFDAACGQYRRTFSAGGSCTDPDADLFILPTNRCTDGCYADTSLRNLQFCRRLWVRPGQSSSEYGSTSPSSRAHAYACLILHRDGQLDHAHMVVSNSHGCTASGYGPAPMASDGTQTVNPSAVGSDTYTLVCSNAAGASPMTSVTLTVNAVATRGRRVPAAAERSDFRPCSVCSRCAPHEGGSCCAAVQLRRGRTTWPRSLD